MLSHHNMLLRRRIRYLMGALLVLTLANLAVASDQSRTVVAGGSITEIVYALGAGDKLVAVDSTSVYPEAAQGLKNIGYVRQLSAEPVLSVSPTLLLVEPSAGPDSALEQIGDAGVEIVRVNDDHTVQGVIEKVQAVAAAMDRQQAGDALVSRLNTRIEQVLAKTANLSTRPRVLFLLSVGRGAPLAAGGDTSAQSVIELAGGVNALDGFSGFKPVSTESIVGANPDVVLITSRTAEAMGGAGKILERPEIAVTPAGQNRRVVVMDGLLLLGFGPRIDQAIAELARQLHPELRFN